jgi:hypothetical protein
VAGILTLVGCAAGSGNAGYGKNVDNDPPPSQSPSSSPDGWGFVIPDSGPLDDLGASSDGDPGTDLTCANDPTISPGTYMGLITGTTSGAVVFRLDPGAGNEMVITAGAVSGLSLVLGTPIEGTVTGKVTCGQMNATISGWTMLSGKMTNLLGTQTGAINGLGFAGTMTLTLPDGSDAGNGNWSAIQ